MYRIYLYIVTGFSRICCCWAFILLLIKQWCIIILL